MGRLEYSLLAQLVNPRIGETLLDIGCGTGHFSRRFRNAGLSVIGVDPDQPSLVFARKTFPEVGYIGGNALALPFSDRAFDHTIAVTSFCFIQQPEAALGELLRVSKKSVVLGLLNRSSLLHSRANSSKSYRKARWDTQEDVRAWLAIAQKKCPILTSWQIRCARSAIFLPAPLFLGRLAEKIIPSRLPLGGFLAVKLECKHSA